MLEWFKKEYNDWDQIWFELFNDNATEFIARPLFGMPLDLNWEAQRNITLMGDAAHILPLNGEGVNLAMLDALNLSENLTNGSYSEINKAISDFERSMLNRFYKEGVDTYEMNEWAYSPAGLKKMVELMK